MLRAYVLSRGRLVGCRALLVVRAPHLGPLSPGTRVWGRCGPTTWTALPTAAYRTLRPQRAKTDAQERLAARQAYDFRSVSLRRAKCGRSRRERICHIVCICRT
jgi:hypothetical protein